MSDSDIKITKNRNWMGAGKGDRLRPGANLDKFRNGWDAIKKRNHSKPEAKESGDNFPTGHGATGEPWTG